jgi:Na+-transporting methylmalonyl-CoA/oxaloacetate decarboxylase, beta subunit
MNAFKNNKAIAVFTIITTLMTLISASFNYFLHMYVSHEFNIDSNKTASIGIIGGSDGPTTIFIVGTPFSSSSITIIFAVLSITGFVYLIYMKEFQK